MKRTLSILLACALALSLLAGCAANTTQLTTDRSFSVNYDGPTELAENVHTALADFGLELLKNTHQEQESTLISPLSIALALSMAANGADGETLAQFEALLSAGGGLDVLDAECARLMADYQSLGGSTEAAIANSLWVDPEGQVREDFIGKCQGIFDAQVFQAELSAPDIVTDLNRWVKEHTNDMIPSIIDEPFGQDTAALLVNALYLNNTWAQEFDPLNTWERQFTHADGQVSTMDFLNESSSHFRYLQDGGAQGVVLPYDDGRLGFFALMPDALAFGDWLDGLSGEALAQQITGAEDTLFYHLALPKFEAEWNGELTDILASMGLDIAFDPDRADFSLLGDNPAGYYLSQVIHATKIKVNKKGTEAAAATVVAAECGSPMPERNGITLIFDRPFLYGIVDLETGVPLFLGTFE